MTTGTGTGTQAPDTALRWLGITGWVEFTSLLVLLANLATAHVAAVASAVGPVHGAAYLTAIAICWARRLPLAARLWCLVPGVGALVAHRTARR